MFGWLISTCAGCDFSGNETPSEDQESISPEVLSIWIPPYLPRELQESIYLPGDVIELNNPEITDMRIDVGSDHQISLWIFALVAPFPTITDEVLLQDLKAVFPANLHQ